MHIRAAPVHARVSVRRRLRRHRVDHASCHLGRRTSRRSTGALGQPLGAAVRTAFRATDGDGGGRAPGGRPIQAGYSDRVGRANRPLDCAEGGGRRCCCEARPLRRANRAVPRYARGTIPTREGGCCLCRRLVQDALASEPCLWLGAGQNRLRRDPRAGDAGGAARVGLFGTGGLGHRLQSWLRRSGAFHAGLSRGNRANAKSISQSGESVSHDLRTKVNAPNNLRRINQLVR